jgi:hypothetical protein
MVDYVGIGLATFTWRQMQNRTDLVKFAQTAAADRLVMQRMGRVAMLPPQRRETSCLYPNSS